MVDQLRLPAGRASLPLVVRHLVLACALTAVAVLAAVGVANLATLLWHLLGTVAVVVPVAVVAGSFGLSKLMCARR